MIAVRRLALAIAPRGDLVTRRTVALAAASVAAGTGAILAAVGLMATSGYLISRAALRPPIPDLMVLFVAVRFFGVVRPTLRYLERLASHELTFRLLAVIRSRFLGALLPLSYGDLAAFRAGDLLSRLAADVDTLQEAWLRVVAPAGIAVIVTAVVVKALAFVDPWIALVVLGLLAFHGAFWSWMAQRQARATGAVRNEQRRAQSADLVSLMQGLEDVLAFGQEEAERARFAERQRGADAVELRDGRQLAVHAAMGTAMTAFAAWCVLVSALGDVASGELSPVWVAALVLATIAAFESVESLPGAWQAAGRTRDSAQRVADVVETAPAVVDAADAVALPAGPAPAIRFERVTFGYASAPVVRDASFEIRSGEHVAVIGPTGVGKSTILTLIERGWDPTSGRITIDGLDLRRVRLRDLRAGLAVLPQQVHVFNETLRENVRLARPSASDADVVEVLTRARLGDFLRGLPAGLDTVLGEHGSRMSAGERQRLGFARLLLTNARLVLADEPTANLDARHERELLGALREWACGRTMVVVSHSRAAQSYVDRVLAMGDGMLTPHPSRPRGG